MKLIANKGVVDNFRSEIEAGRLSHAFMIEGERGSGRLCLARTLASIVEGCESGAGYEKIMSGDFPDVFEYIPESANKQIGIDAVRDIIKSAHVVPSQSPKSVFIIENADMMTPAAQNALLQIFEEPPKTAMFFLLCSERNLFLKTLLSRARVINTERLTDGEVERLLLERFPDKKDIIPRAVHLAGGVAGRGVELLENEASSKMLTVATSYAKAASGGATFGELAKLVNIFHPMTREELFSFASYLCLALRDAGTVQFGQKSVFFEDGKDAENLARYMGMKKIVKAFDTCQTVMKKSAVMSVTSSLANINTYFAADFN